MSGTAIRETLGALSVLAGLVFVGVEIRQNNSLAHGQARQALADMSQEWLLAVTQDPEYFGLWERAWINCEELSASDASRAYLMMFGQLRRQENAFFQHTEGLVDESALTAYGAAGNAPHFQCSRFQELWATYASSYNIDFGEFLSNSLEMDDL
jgi:hypothetical protein